MPKPQHRPPPADPAAKQPDGSTPFGQGQPDTTITQDEQARLTEAQREEAADPGAPPRAP
ncbi:MAG: hypothetical protein ABI655_05965 [Phenylobacterium sp.]